MHQRIQDAGWTYVNTRGTQRVYEKNGKRYSIPFHGSGSIAPKTRKRIEKLFDL
ncbi:MAG TPA: type II toxin-antitoxin system HicA family toxin [Pricia sp.]|nr:type II toxin-antitoxin system HicA family toxin [Pricia sp.]